MSLIEIPDPPGYKVVAYRPPKRGEWYMDGRGGKPLKAGDDFDLSYHFILEPVEVWRAATIDDLKRAPCRARFRDKNSQVWANDRLSGWKYTGVGIQWFSSDDCAWRFCQVLEVPNE